jgi:hypothetical protein
MLDTEKFVEWLMANFSDYSPLRWAFLYKSNKVPKDYFSTKYLMDFFSWIWNNFRWMEDEDVYINSNGKELKINEVYDMYPLKQM